MSNRARRHKMKESTSTVVPAYPVPQPSDTSWPWYAYSPASYRQYTELAMAHRARQYQYAVASRIYACAYMNTKTSASQGTAYDNLHSNSPRICPPSHKGPIESCPLIADGTHNKIVDSDKSAHKKAIWAAKRRARRTKFNSPRDSNLIPASQETATCQPMSPTLVQMSFDANNPSIPHQILSNSTIQDSVSPGEKRKSMNSQDEGSPVGKKSRTRSSETESESVTSDIQRRKNTGSMQFLIFEIEPASDDSLEFVLDSHSRRLESLKNYFEIVV